MESKVILILVTMLSSFAKLNSELGSKECRFSAIFNFGDSNSDTGGLSSAFPAYMVPPYGETYFHEPVGRFSDGRILIDFIAESLELPYVRAYLDSLKNIDFNNGANFATSASTIRLPKLIKPTHGGFSPFFLDVQFNQFVRLKSLLQKTITNHKVHFENALYTFDIGQNDLGEGIFAHKSLQEINASIPDIVESFTTNFKKIYNVSGGKSYWIHNTGPIGCLPYILITSPSAERDEAGCAKAINEVAKYFNHVLKQAIDELRSDFPLASITYVDLYSAKYALFTQPEYYGLELPLVSCCGYGGKYNYNDKVGCGGTLTVNGTQIVVGSCGQASTRVIWDGIHFTEAASKILFQQISTGAFSDPPIPSKRACYKSFKVNYSQ